MVVGDAAQAIYSFRSASVRNIPRFSRSLPAARRITLEQNYRSTRPILEASNAVTLARERPKELWAVRQRRGRVWSPRRRARAAAQVCGNVLEHREQGTQLMRGRKVPYESSQRPARAGADAAQYSVRQAGGLKFLEAAHQGHAGRCAS
jgi:DNA helicase-2/ATP-dependent DNA helicase PcrA